MTLLSSMLRRSSESMTVPLKNRGSLVTQCTPKYTNENGSHQCTVPYTQAHTEANLPHMEESYKWKNAAFKRE